MTTNTTEKPDIAKMTKPEQMRYYVDCYDRITEMRKSADLKCLQLLEHMTSLAVQINDSDLTNELRECMEVEQHHAQYNLNTITNLIETTT